MHLGTGFRWKNMVTVMDFLLPNIQFCTTILQINELHIKEQVFQSIGAF